MPTQLTRLADAVQRLELQNAALSAKVEMVLSGQTEHKNRLDRIDDRLERGDKRFYAIDVEDAKRTGIIVGSTKTLTLVGGLVVAAVAALGGLTIKYGITFVDFIANMPKR